MQKTITGLEVIIFETMFKQKRNPFKIMGRNKKKLILDTSTRIVLTGLLELDRILSRGRK